MPVVTGHIGSFVGSVALIPHVQLFFVPPTFGQAEDFLFATADIPAVIDPSGNFTVTCATTVNLRPPTDNQGRPWGYGIRVQWLNGAGIPTGYDVPDMRVYVPVEGGDIRGMTSMPILPTQLWVNADGSEPHGSKRGDLIWNTTTDDITRII